jgi:hypothetical protein
LNHVTSLFYKQGPILEIVKNDHKLRLSSHHGAL